MKETIVAMLIAIVAAADPDPSWLQAGVNPHFITGLITVGFLYVMLRFGFGNLAAIQCPPYQLKYDDKNKENNRDW